MASILDVAKLGLIAWLVAKVIDLLDFLKKKGGEPGDPVRVISDIPGAPETVPSDVGLPGLAQRLTGVAIIPAGTGWIPIQPGTSAEFVDAAWLRSFLAPPQGHFVAERDIPGINLLFRNLAHNETLKNAEGWLGPLPPSHTVAFKWNSFMSEFQEFRRTVLGALKGLVDAGETKP